MVRSGLLIYGWSPASHPMSGLDLRPVLTWKSRILSIKTIRKGESVSYGRSWIAENDEQVAVVPVGYHDGYDRGLSPGGQVLVEGQRAAVVGDVCMDNMVILITGNPKVRLWSEVVLMGSQGDQSVTPLDMAKWSHTIPWEVLCRIGRRIPRVYCWNEKKIARFSFLDSVVPTRVLDEAVDAG
jgi:alanine racemase